jgi:shikimate dehydrogenase
MQDCPRLRQMLNQEWRRRLHRESKAKRFAVLGSPLTKSLSPIIHQAFAKQFDLNIEYTSIEVNSADLQTFVTAFFAKGGAGLNITAPHKEQAYKLSNTATISAQFAGAVNTLKIEAGSLYGDNTDGIGFIRDLQRQEIALHNKRILILGAGGAARGILPAMLEQLPSRITLVNRNLSKAQRIADDFKQARMGKILVADYTQIADQKYDVIINATSAGLESKLPPIPAEFNFKDSYCYDLNYQEKSKAFMQYAQAQGAKMAIDGLGMLVEQAAEAFYFWHGLKPATTPVLVRLHLSFAK